MGLAAGYRTYYDRGYNLQIEERNPDPQPIEEEYIEYNGGFNNLVLGSGFSYKNNFMFGASISIPLFSDYSQEYENHEGSEVTESGTLKGTFFTSSVSFTYFFNNSHIR